MSHRLLGNMMQTARQMLFVVMVGTSMMAGGCQEPETFQPRIPTADAESYAFDFIMLAEWGGRIFSEISESSSIYSDNTGKLFSQKPQTVHCLQFEGNKYTYSILSSFDDEATISVENGDKDCNTFICHKETSDIEWCNPGQLHEKDVLYRCQPDTSASQSCDFTDTLALMRTETIQRTTIFQL